MASTAASEAEASEIRRRGRRRLIGAVVLVALLVVFIPMLLDSEPRPARPGPDASIPSKDKVAPLPPPKPTSPLGDAAKSPSPVGDPAKAPSPLGETRGEGKSAAGKAALPPPSPPVPAKPADAPKLEGFAVQVRAFRDEGKLKQSREKLVGAGVVHYTERLEAKGGALTRLRAGPFATREQAEAALVKLKRASIDGKVVPLP